MDRSDLAPRIDHTVVGPLTTPDDVATVLETASEWDMNACIPPYAIAEFRDTSPDLTIMTVVGFPHGQHAPEIKRREAIAAVDDGADELDLVMNLGRLRAGDEQAARADLEAAIAAVEAPVKVIVEAPLLDAATLRRACEVAMNAGASMLKTSTGFADGGATTEDVALMAEYGPVKASGGIRTYADALEMLEAGAERIGSSTGDAVLEGADPG